ncbi:DUF4224 domain-containing protein [Undibacterium crateris]|uniref:DUF4224 domain-containing protein n=1 Tax=Undibacterium crateris TaxID=2528175 RepID=UPI00138A1F1A|nr:DUF4224 domain-containing protein [Undibacterium crateris]
MFLTDNELRELTGYAYRSKQILWLKKNNWKFELTAQLRPRVARSYFEVRLGAASGISVSTHIDPAPRPNFGALSQLIRR